MGGESFKKSYQALADMGRLFVFGVSSLAPGKKRNMVAALRGFFKMRPYKPIELMNHNKGVLGVNLGHLWHRSDELAEMLGEILDLFSDGTFTPVVDEAFGFSEAAAAHRYIQDRRNFGKVILVP